MKRISQLALHSGLSMVTLLSLANCGASKAVDATNSMPGRIDATNAQVTETNTKMDTMVNSVQKTNDGMDTMVVEVKKTNDGMDTMVDEVKKTNDGMGTMVDQVKKTNDGMNTMVKEVQTTNDGMNTMVNAVNKTNEGMSKTNAAIHNQTLAVALTTMLSDDNTKQLQPPTDMLPAAQVFANEASAFEIVQLANTIMTGVQIPAPGDATSDHRKLAKVAALESISALMSQDKVQQMINDQITAGGQYESTAYQVLAFRYDFISAMLLGGAQLNQPLTNPGLAQDAIGKAQVLTMIASLPYVDKIQAPILSMNDDHNNRTIAVKPADASAKWLGTTPLWKAINRSLTTDMDPKYTAADAPTAVLVAALKAEVAKHIPPKVTPVAAPAPASTAP